MAKQTHLDSGPHRAAFNRAAAKPVPDIATKQRAEFLERMRNTLQQPQHDMPMPPGARLSSVRVASLVNLEKMIRHERGRLNQAQSKLRDDFGKANERTEERVAAYRKAREARQAFREAAKDRDRGRER